MQILNLNTKTIENKHLIHYLYYLKRFPQTSSACFVMLTSKRNYIISAFYCCPNSQCSYIFKNRWLFPLQTFISLIIRFLFKCPRQEAKTKQQQNKTDCKVLMSQMSQWVMSQWVNESMCKIWKNKSFSRNNKIKYYFYLFCLLPSLLPAQGLSLTWNLDLDLGCLLAVPRPSCRIAEAKNKPA